MRTARTPSADTASALVDAARKAGVRHFVHTSVCEAGRHTQFPRWESGYWWQKYWTDKWDVEERVRAAGFARWTILKPAFLMDNFASPKAAHMFPHLRQGEILTAFLPQTAPAADRRGRRRGIRARGARGPRDDSIGRTSTSPPRR